METLYDEAELSFGIMRDMPKELQDTLVNLVDAGEVQSNLNWVRQFNEGYYAKAADSLLVNRPYMDAKALGTNTNLVNVLESASKVLIKYDGGFGDE